MLKPYYRTRKEFIRARDRQVGLATGMLTLIAIAAFLAWLTG